MAGDVKFLSLADVVAELVCAGEVISGLADGAGVQTEDAKTGPGHGQLGVELQGAFVVVFSFGDVVALLMGFVAQGIGAEGFKRRRGGLTERRIESLDTGETFSQFGAHAGSNLVERIEHVLFVRRGCLFAGDIVAAGGVLRVEGNNIGFAKRSDGAGKDSFDALPFADFACNLRGNGLVLFPAEVLETLPQMLLTDDVEYRRLAKLYPQGLVQGGVKDRLSSLIDEVRDDDGIFGGNWFCGLTRGR